MGKPQCLTLETACLFGACAFTIDVLCKLWELVFSIVLIGFTWQKYGNMVVRAQVIVSFFSSVYCTFSLILAFFLFRGIFSKLGGVIKLGGIFVLVLRLWECAGSLVSWGDGDVTTQLRDEFGVHRANKIGRFVVTNLASALFVAVLFLYYRSLSPPRHRDLHHHHRSKTSRHSTSTLSI